MAGPKGQEKGTRQGAIALRVGQDVDRFIGVHTERDPGAIPRNAFQAAINARLKGGMPVERGGQEKVITTAVDGAWEGLCDALGGANDGTQRLYVSGVVATPSEPALLFWI